ncbi:MAG: hypothetical protein JNJ48_02910 [Phycisphaerae bacterium]|nr:hypothetical protein [Phycisphaerae bacterium]
MNPQRSEPDPLAAEASRARLDRMEETLAFTERAVERFGGQLEEISRGLERLLRRVEAMERRVEGLAASSRQAESSAGETEEARAPE